MQENQSEQTKALFKHLSFYLHENRKWERAMHRHFCWTIPLIALTLFATYKNKPFVAIGNAFASTIGIKCICRANFYRRRAAYRVRQQKRSLEK